MAILGAHMSIAGGCDKAVKRAATAGCDCLQIFTKNNNQWNAKPLTEDDAQKFREALQSANISHPLSHASYLINLASPNDVLREKSIDAFVVELERAEWLGIPYVVVHPGSFTTGSEVDGIVHLVSALDAIHQRLPKCKTQCLLENTAGQGSNLGWEFQQLAQMLEGVKHAARVGVCFDTCHAFAAGYPLDTQKNYRATMRQLDQAVGLAKVKAFHLNDSKQPLGSRRDRHEHIGRGELGLEPFRNLLNDSRWKKIPMYLETPKGTEQGEDLDVINLRTLRNLLGK